jgi:hypothetical protein
MAAKKVKAMTETQLKSELQKLGVVGDKQKMELPNFERWLQIVAMLLELFKQFKDEDQAVASGDVEEGDEGDETPQTVGHSHHGCCDNTIYYATETLKAAIEHKVLCCHEEEEEE